MTEIFKVGEHIKLVRSDRIYEEELGNQTGLVGTIVQGNSIGGGVYVTFPHTGDAQFYYVPSEFERAGKAPAPEPKPEPEPLKIGDWVKVENYSVSWDGTVGQITEVRYGGVSIKDTKGQRLSFPKRSVALTEAPASPVYGVGDRVEFTEGYSFFGAGDAGTVTALDTTEGSPVLLEVDMDCGRHTSAFTYRFKHSTKTEPVPPSKFKVGDWVEVTGYGSTWDTVKGQITTVREYDVRAKRYNYIIKTHDFSYATTGGFAEKFLKATTAPNKFKVGDWVEITGWSRYCDGQVLQIADVPNGLDKLYYAFADNGGGFTDKYLRAVEEPHWTITKPVGATAQALFSGGTVNRILTKIDKDEWLHIYQNSDGSGQSIAKRTNQRTKELFGSSPNLRWLS